MEAAHLDGRAPASPHLDEAAAAEASRLLADSVRGFGGALTAELYKAGQNENESEFLSPYGISVCLALVLLGARHNTLKQMLQAMQIDPARSAPLAGGHGEATHEWAVECLAPAYSALAAEVQRDAAASQTKLLQANAAVLNMNHALLQGGQLDDPHHPVRKYVEVIKRHMAAKLIEAVDDQQAGKQVDAFAAEQTNGLIRQMNLELNANTLMVLLNAIYFKANFTDKFDTALTKPAEFTCFPSGSRSTVQMMTKHAKLPYTEQEGMQAVRLAYAGEMEAFSLTIALPQDASPEGLRATVDRLKLHGLRALRFRSSKGTLFLPRFKFEARRVLNAPLMALGMTDAFEEGKADLSGIAKGAYVSQVVHKAVVEVNEEGTEAAAVTAAVVMQRCAVMRPEAPWEMRCERPFVFVIEHNATGLPLFVGVVKHL